uniref:RRM domain-containing protein n=1 Tax=Gouania willdenowi TaxID=441366 RepID=A0A8C5N734_GOUWI
MVVQVMGELSNNMQPMRRFAQTFVLAPEGTTSNKFYIHNDVFMYQDEVFQDSDSEPPEESEEDKILSSRPIELFDNVESEGRRMVRYPDAHQLFVGNIPHDVEKPELMEFFEQFGSVLDFKIISREKHPNFGFVVFNDSEPVQKILSSRPIELFDNMRLNVQKKKTHSPREAERGDASPLCKPWVTYVHARDKKQSSMDQRLLKLP